MTLRLEVLSRYMASSKEHGEPPVGAKAPDYELVADPSLRAYLTNFEKAAERKGIAWPIQSSKIGLIFAGDLKLPRYRVIETVNQIREYAIVDFIRTGNRKSALYVLNRDEARVVAALCWSITESPKVISFKKRCDSVRKALGRHPLVDLVRDPILPLPKQVPNWEGKKSIIPRGMTKPAEIGKGYFLDISPEELEGSEEIKIKQLEEYLERAKGQIGREQISASKIGINPNVLKIIISCVVVARRKQERSEEVLREKRNFLLEELTYEHLVNYVKDCLFLLRMHPDVKNLYTLFIRAKETLEKQSGKVV